MRQSVKRAATTAATLMVTGMAITAPALAQNNVSVIMSGLDNPRGLAFGADGGLYVTEAGRGGSGIAEIRSGSGDIEGYGATSGVSRFLNGVQQRVVVGLPSLANQSGPQPGGGATGLQDIVFDGAGQAFGIVGFGADPALRSAPITPVSATSSGGLGVFGAGFGQLVRLNVAAGTSTNVVDVAAFESASNPDGQDLNSNPYALAVAPGGSGFAVVDAGANALLRSAPGSATSLLSLFPPQPNPLPFGPPAYQAVPTSVALGADGAFYVGQLTGFPFPAGGANVFRVDAVTGQRTVAASGFTNIIDLAFGASGDNSLYVLQLTANGLAAPNGPGAGQLLRVDLATGAKTVIAGANEGLLFPTGLAAGSDGAFYVSNRGNFAGGGQVLRISVQAIPEPGTLALVGAVLPPILIAVKRRGRRRA